MSKLWLKYQNWSKLGIEQQVYRYTLKVYRYTLAQNDQKRKCTGTLSECTGTSHPKCPKMCVFSHFSIYLIPNSTLYSIYTSKPFHIPCKLNYTQIIFQYISFFKIFHDFFPKTILIWFITHTHTKYTILLGFVLTRTLLLCN